MFECYFFKVSYFNYLTFFYPSLLTFISNFNFKISNPLIFQNSILYFFNKFVIKNFQSMWQNFNSFFYRFSKNFESMQKFFSTILHTVKFFSSINQKFRINVICRGFFLFSSFFFYLNLPICIALKFCWKCRCLSAFQSSKPRHLGKLAVPSPFDFKAETSR